jgi:MFS superfamily sulfate permease-like transporter
MLTRELADGTSVDDEDVAALARQLPKGVVVYEINGPLFFGAAERFRNVLGEISENPRALIVRMRHVPAMDSTGLHALRELVRRSMRDRTAVILSEVLDVIDSFGDALARATEIAQHARGTTGAHPVPAGSGH